MVAPPPPRRRGASDVEVMGAGSPSRAPLGDTAPLIQIPDVDQRLVDGHRMARQGCLQRSLRLGGDACHGGRYACEGTSRLIGRRLPRRFARARMVRPLTVPHRPRQTTSEALSEPELAVTHHPVVHVTGPHHGFVLLRVTSTRSRVDRGRHRGGRLRQPGLYVSKPRPVCRRTRRHGAHRCPELVQPGSEHRKCSPRILGWRVRRCAESCTTRTKDSVAEVLRQLL